MIRQILAKDMICSIDSVLPAVGTVIPDRFAHAGMPLLIVIASVRIAVAAMATFADPVLDFPGRQPTVKMLALSFMILIAVVLMVVVLIAEGFHPQIPWGHVDSVMALPRIVGMLNLGGRREGDGDSQDLPAEQLPGAGGAGHAHHRALHQSTERP